jgi:tRNA nucleotidyltransferase/poly(A) polymerase
MRELTFVGFLKRYLKGLSFNNSTNLAKLSKELLDNPRLREPLFLYVVFMDKQKMIIQELINDHEYIDFIQNYDKKNLIELLNESKKGLKEEYLKVWRSYLSEKNKPVSDYHTKELILKNILKIKKAKEISNYRIYTELDLNHGNINAWLKNGECNKVSLEIARKILRFTQGFNIQ